jgi:hypothetical protein
VTTSGDGGATTPWTDDAIEFPEADRLNRKPFSTHAAQIVNRIGRFPSSTVVGLVGPWGSGKTSILNLMEGELDPEWRIARFEPWAVGDVGGLIQGFFITISGTLPAGRAPRLTTWLAGRLEAATPLLAAVPHAGEAARDFLQIRQSDKDESRRTETGMRELGAELAEAGIRVLVVIDDVDRLLPDELLMLLKAVRLLGRIPQVHYLLAYDERTLLDVLRKTAFGGADGRRAQDYLDKIVQIRLDVPAVQRVQADRLVQDGLQRIFDGLGVTLPQDERQRLNLAYQLVLSRTLTEPRTILRFLAQVETLLPYVGPDEINVVDFVLVTYLRVTYPRLHRRLRVERGQLIEDDPRLALSARETARLGWSGTVVEEGVPEQELSHVRELLAHLFPGPARYPDDTWLLGTFAPGRQRVGDPAYFERYFALGVPEDDLSDVMVRDALAAIGSDLPDPARSDLETILLARPGDSELQTRALAKLSTLTPSIQDDQFAPTIRFLITVHADLTGGGLLSDPATMAVGWAAALLQRFAPQVLDVGTGLLTTLTTGRALEMTVRALATRADRFPPGSPLAREVASAALAVVEDNLRARDDAPIEPIAAYLEFAEEHLPREDVRRVIGGGLRDGRWTTADVAARLVSLAVSADGRSEPHEFDAAALLRLVPPSLLVDVPEEGATAEPGRNDQSWAARRRFARPKLIAEIEGVRDGPLPDLPTVLRPSTDFAFHRYAPGRYLPVEPYDLLIRCAVHLPTAGGDSDATAAEGSRETALTEILDRIDATAWARSVAATWGLPEPLSWTAEGANTGDESTFTLRADGPASRRPPVLLRAYVRIKRSTDDGSLALLLDTTFNLLELGPDRRPDGARHASAYPAPAALSVRELHAAVRASTSAVGAATQAHQLLLGRSASAAGRAALFLSVGGSLTQVVNLKDFRVVPGGSAPQTSMLAYEVRVTSMGGPMPLSADHLGALLLQEALRPGQHRDFGPTLRELAFPEPS